MKRQETSAERKKTVRMKQRLKLEKNTAREMMCDVDRPIIRYTTEKKVTNETVSKSNNYKLKQREAKNNRTHKM